MPKGYIIITEDVKDPAGMADYGKLAGKAMAGATLLSFDQRPEVLEGVVARQPDRRAGVRVRRSRARLVPLGRVSGGGQASPGRSRLQRRHRLRPLRRRSAASIVEGASVNWRYFSLRLGC